MKTIKVIDILNKIANGEKVRFKILDNYEIRDEIFEVENGHLRNSTCGKWLETKVSHDTWESISSYFLNEEVEIIEEKKLPKKYTTTSINDIDNLDDKIALIHVDLICVNDKVNKIIDYLESKEKGE